MTGSKQYALDTSFLIFHYYRPGVQTTKILCNGVLNHVTLSETLYVLCRKESISRSAEYIKQIVKQSYSIVPSEDLMGLAGQFKCRFPIALADCWTLATARQNQIPCLFAMREDEIIKQLVKLQEEVRIVFLDQLI